MEPSRLLGLFLSESREHLTSAYDLLARLESRPDDREALQSLMRHAHSLKGMGATMGFESMVRLAHALEDEFERLQAASQTVSSRSLGLLHDALARLGGIIDHVEQGAGAEDRRAEEVATALRKLASAEAGGEVDLSLTDRNAEGSPDDGNDDRTARYRVDVIFSRAIARGAETTVAALTRLGRLGRMISIDPPRLSGNPPRFDGCLRLTLDYPGSREALHAEIERIPGVAHVRVDRPPAERSSAPPVGPAPRWARVREDLLDAVAESTVELLVEQGRLRDATRAGLGLRERLDRADLLVKELYGAVTELRLVPFSSVMHRLRQTVSELERRLERRVVFRIRGGEIQLDRALLDALGDPLLHMVRNAMDHGLEPAAERRAAGKPGKGSLSLSVERHGDRVSISLEDDGRGLDVALLKRSAVEGGFLSAVEAAELSDAEAFRLVMLPAFSTARRISGLSGRGVGMDVVRDAVERLGGRLQIRSRPGHGTCFEMTLPLHQALIQVLLLRCCGGLYAVPISPFRRTLDLLEAQALREGPRLPLLDLRRRLSVDAAETSPRDGGSVLVLGLEGGEVGLVVDEILGRREIVIRPLRPPLDRTRELLGAAALEDGEVVLVLDPHRCVAGWFDERAVGFG
jgi:two-component system chemotaxis sensor kinase CheA